MKRYMLEISGKSEGETLKISLSSRELRLYGEKSIDEAADYFVSVHFPLRSLISVASLKEV